MGRRPRSASPRQLSWDTSLPDWERLFLAGEPLVPDLPLYQDEAIRGLRVFKRLRLPDVIGTPTLGEAGGDWVFPIVSAVFGSYDPVADKRRIQEFMLLIPKKNGKSTIGAAVMLTAVLRNRRPEAEFIFVASTLEVAGIAFRQARGMIKLDPRLRDMFHVQDNIKRLTYTETGAFLQIRAMDADVITGSKPVGTLVDEVHLWASKAHAADLFLEIRGSLAARPDGFLFQISTQSKSIPAGVFKSELQRARDVRDGKLRLPKPLLPVLYELPKALEKDWRKEEYWPLVNPNLGKSVDPEALRSWLVDAERQGMAQLALFASQHFNVEIGQGLRSDGWVAAEHWSKQTDPDLDLERLLDRAEVVICGVDGGGLDDLLGLCVLGRDRETKDWLAWGHAWCHEGVLQRRQTIASRLRDFERAGELTICDDELADIDALVEIAADIKSRGLLAAVAVDPAGIGQLVDALAEAGITIENKQIVGCGQGYQMMSAMKTTERKLANGTMWHSASSLMAWCVSNVKVEALATSIRPTKANAGDAKIDAAMALLDAVQVMSQMPARAPTYELTFV